MYMAFRTEREYLFGHLKTTCDKRYNKSTIDDLITLVLQRI